LYNLVERPDEDWGASYFGGEPEDYDVVKNRSTVAGSGASWSQIQSIASGGVTEAEYPTAQSLVDFDSLIDHILENVWLGNTDWDHNNSVSVRRRVPSGPWVFPNWDAEFSISMPPGGQTTAWEPILNINRTNINTSNGSSAIFQGLRQNPEFALRVADRVHKHFFRGGVMTPESARALWLRRAAEVHRAFVGESARWGDFRRDVYSRRDPQSAFPLFTRDEHYLAHQRWILDEYFPQRADIIISQFESAGYWPGITPPDMPEGGEVAPGTTIDVSGSNGDLYYTLDGSDPRLEGGAISPSAIRVGDGGSSILVANGAATRYLIPTDGSLNLDWTETDFDDSSWDEGATPFGYDRNATYQPIIETDVSEMDGGNTSLYLRVPFSFDGNLDFDSLTLRVQYDDGFMTYLNGTPLIGRNVLPGNLTWNSSATANNPDSSAVVLQEIDLTEVKD
ncbi:MAG: CotH kinase family protein, partial [Planctomycetota bacterium]